MLVGDVLAAVLEGGAVEQGTVLDAVAFEAAVGGGPATGLQEELAVAGDGE